MSAEIAETTTGEEVLKEYQCIRCGFAYHKLFDYEPFLCYRCIRFIAKKSWVIMHTIQPPTSTTVKDDV